MLLRNRWFTYPNLLNVSRGTNDDSGIAYSRPAKRLVGLQGRENGREISHPRRRNAFTGLPATSLEDDGGEYLHYRPRYCIFLATHYSASTPLPYSENGWNDRIPILSTLRGSGSAVDGDGDR